MPYEDHSFFVFLKNKLNTNLYICLVMFDWT
jgi:hypothetical protein